MVFSSIIFLTLFLPIFLLVYYFIDKKYKNYALLLASVLFYSWGAPRFIFVILGTTFLDFYLVRIMDRSLNSLMRKFFLILSISINLGLLVYFKYSNFFIENLNSVVLLFGGKQIIWAKLLLPIGISFYTFESITYVVDVYKKIHKPLAKFWDYQLYIILFPKLIAGPIVRYHEIADQITDRSGNDTIDFKLSGFFRFCIGLGKKAVIANTFAPVVDHIFWASGNGISSSTAWLGIISYTFQIYFDFSGYSDMAIGIGQMIGFKFPENFNNPYSSGSITEFWRKWHITLGNWMKNYLYIPLGGNKVKSKWKMYLNLWLVFIASGFWHGASWNFIVWGIYHGLFLVLERLFLQRFYDRAGKWISIPATFLVIMIGWVFFRTENLHSSIVFLKQLFAFDFNEKLFLDLNYSVCLALAFIFSFFTVVPVGRKIQEKIYSTEIKLNIIQSISFTLACFFLFFYSFSSIAASSFNPFIYFRF